jgi:hypothetical protein
MKTINSLTARGSRKTALFLEVASGGDNPYVEYAKFGGWNPKENKFLPMQFTDMATECDNPGSATNYALDCIALSYEAGFFADTKAFLKGAFETPRDLFVFCEQLHEYQFWLNERHFYAFLDLLNWDESEMRTYEEVADALEQAFENL